MKIISFGSLNIDRVYQVSQFVRPGETILAQKLEFCVGGKGLNQSIAASKAGVPTIHAGAVGEDGAFLTDYLRDSGVDISRIAVLPGASGHAVIQVDSQGRNCIIVFGGANQQLSTEYIDSVLEAEGERGDIVLLQYETNHVPYIIRRAHEMGLRVAFNPSPIPERLEELPLDCVDFFILNEVEGAHISGIREENPDFRAVLSALAEKYPSAVIVLTIGSEGSLCKAGDEVITQDIFRVSAVDTTAAGDTFCGYFLAGYCRGLSLQDCMRNAAAASAIAVSRMGAAPSIPCMQEVEKFLEDQKKP
ncbi:MAG: ribokinase [Clostridiales bacterium]|nr:ribokinase [Clostridiales bacterium]